jgi:hypothetical protein
MHPLQVIYHHFPSVGWLIEFSDPDTNEMLYTTEIHPTRTAATADAADWLSSWRVRDLAIRQAPSIQ